MIEHKNLDKIYDEVKDFKLLLVFYFVLLILGIIILLFLSPAISCNTQSPQTPISCQLRGSLQTPWGVVTSFLVNASWNNLANEYLTLLIPISCFILINLNIEKKKRTKRCEFFIYASFLIMVFSTLLWVALYGRNTYTIGLSGITYAGMGLALGFAIVNIVKEFKLIEKRTRCYKGVFLVNIIIAITLIGLVLFNPATFFNISTGTNVFVHQKSFLLGSIAGLAYVIITK